MHLVSPPHTPTIIQTRRYTNTFQENDSDESNAYISLHEKSLVDLTKYVKDGKLTWTTPKDYKEYVLFAHYERYTNQRSADGVPTDVIANGSWVTDHFSATGAKLAASFWEKNLLTTQIRQLLKEVGKHSRLIKFAS